MISYLLPTHNRPEQLRETLHALGQLCALRHEPYGGAEVIVVDNASDPPAICPNTLDNGFEVKTLTLNENRGASARNDGARIATGQWLIMLDDDSHPMHEGHLDALEQAPDDVMAIGAEIFLQDGTHEAGGLPEVIIGCGAAIRREKFLSVGGYDPSFDFYAEEYDLCAKLMLGGGRVVHDVRFQVLHRKVQTGRDMNRILARLVRNNGWVIQRYAPEAIRKRELAEMLRRYESIAKKENSLDGYERGLAQLAMTMDDQPRREMNAGMYERFTGEARARSVLTKAAADHGFECFRIAFEGKNAQVIRRVLRDLNIVETHESGPLGTCVIGTLSPGPALDALAKFKGTEKPVICPGCPVVVHESSKSSLERVT